MAFEHFSICSREFTSSIGFVVSKLPLIDIAVRKQQSTRTLLFAFHESAFVLLSIRPNPEPFPLGLTVLDLTLVNIPVGTLVNAETIGLVISESTFIAAAVG